MKENRSQNSKMFDAIRIIAPGTFFREGLDSILRAKTGALIVIGDSLDVMELVDGGFEINTDYTPPHIYELAKMDGAIILSEDKKRILYANTQLIPDHSIQTTETGTRHRTADRVAKQTGKLVIAISQRRNVITLYKDNEKYILNDTGRILTRANQALQTLEKYKLALDNAMTNLTVVEFKDIVTLSDAVFAIQRSEMVMRIAFEIDKYISELGNESRLISMQLEELLGDTEQDERFIISDYCMSGENKQIEKVLQKIRMYSQAELLEQAHICKTLGYHGGIGALDESVSPKGYRMLNKVPRMPFTVVDNLVDNFGNLQGVLKASIDDLDDVEGIGEVRAKGIKETFRKIQERLMINNRRI